MKEFMKREFPFMLLEKRVCWGEVLESFGMALLIMVVLFGIYMQGILFACVLEG